MGMSVMNVCSLKSKKKWNASAGLVHKFTQLVSDPSGEVEFYQTTSDPIFLEFRHPILIWPCTEQPHTSTPVTFWWCSTSVCRVVRHVVHSECFKVLKSVFCVDAVFLSAPTSTATCSCQQTWGHFQPVLLVSSRLNKRLLCCKSSWFSFCYSHFIF